MFNLNYKKGKLVTELKNLQERKELVQEELRNGKMFPHCPCGVRYYSYKETTEDLADAIAQLWLHKISSDEFNLLIKRIYKIDNSIEYFESLGKYFVNLSGNIEEIQKLNKELEELEFEEKQLKDKLGIK